MENASKALIIAGAILLSILIIALGIFVYNAAKGAVNTDQLDAVELQTFNGPIEQYEGKQSGAEVKALISNLITNAGTNSEADERLPDIKYVNSTTGPAVDVGSGFKVAAKSKANFTLNSTVGNTRVQEMSNLRTAIVQKHNYTVTIGYDTNTGLVNLVTITY